MINEAKNKALGTSESKPAEPKAATIKAVSVIENEYFYPEQDGYQAISVRAATKQDADSIYLERRKPVNPGKVEAAESNNE